MSILSLKGGNVVDAVVNAVVAGYRDDLILEELATALEDETITKDQFKGAVEGLELYVARFADSIKTVSSAMAQFEFNEKQSIIKNRPLNLAQQVMQDVDGFKGAVKEYYNDDENTQPKEADIKKPAPAAPAAAAPAAPKVKEEPKKVVPPVKKEPEVK
jgi:hypothetical protein